MVLTACISKSGCFSNILCKAVCTGVNCCRFIGKSKYFSVMSLDLYSCLYGLLAVLNFATVNLSDFSCSMLILLTSSLEAMSLLGILIVLQGHVV